jgi:signal transduction histidine kinase/CheY-like chemotaxis protein/HPt (histidine-containing phosphotransfer) domain-containing protein
MRRPRLKFAAGPSLGRWRGGVERDATDDGALISAEDRRRIASGGRVTVALIGLSVLIVALFTGLVVLSVSEVFRAMTPAVRQDLAWKALRGAVELSHTGEYGLLVADAKLVRDAANDHLASSDVAGLVAQGVDGEDVLCEGEAVPVLRRVFSLPPGQVHELDGVIAAWTEAQIEGAPVGRVALGMSTARIRAGEELEGRILVMALVSGLCAVLLSLGFVARYIWPVLRVTQAAFARLEQKTEEALAAARLKAQFLANMSHEIRTPMNAVVGLSKLMLGMPLNPKLRRYAELIDASSRALLGIINDVLDFSKIEAGKYRIERSSCELALILQEVAELLAERAHSKGIDLVYRVAPEVPRMVTADGDRIRQVLLNLVGNAVKFTERGEVYVELSVDDTRAGVAQLRFRVEDSGIGVPDELKEHVFDAFSQADGSLVRKHGGTGLGLTISRQLVLLMDGAIGLTSQLGEGSTFWFTLPAAVEDATPAIHSRPSSIGRSALVVSANSRAATALDEHCRAWGMRTRVVAHTEAALGALGEEGAAFDLVLYAESQQAERGEAFVKAVRPRLKRAKVVLLALHRDGATRSELDHEIAAQLTHPVRMSELYETLSNVLVGRTVRPDAPVPEHKRPSFGHARVLVVDDNAVNQFVAVEQLQRFGCQIDQAYNGKDALDAVLAHSYDLVLMDCQMPIMDGYTATRLIREREGSAKHTVIVALTAHALDGDRAQVLAAGMDDYLTKPVRPQTLQRTLERWIGTGASGPRSDEASGVGPRPVSAQAESAAQFDADDELAESSTALLTLFMEQIPMQLERLDGALAMAEPDDVRKHAHKLKGSLLAVGARRLARIAETLQHLGDDALPEGERLFAQLLAAYPTYEERVRAELRGRARAARQASDG